MITILLENCYVIVALIMERFKNNSVQFRMYRYLIGRRCLSRLLGQPTNFSHPELIAADEVTPFIKVDF